MNNVSAKEKPAWVELIKPYQTPDHWKSVWQLINSVVPYFIVWGLMIYSLRISYLLTLALALLNALFVMRIFIIQHDCGHNSFFRSPKLNDLVGIFMGIITLTPYHRWRRRHAQHHASSGDLDFRGIGDVPTITVEEYRALNWKGKLRYRFFRHPLVLFVIGPTILFAVINRVAFDLKKGEDRERNSVWFTNVALLVIFLAMGSWLGYSAVLLLWAPLTIFSAVIGVYLFYVQHQFEDTYWRWHEEWDYAEAALRGSSFLKLPKVLQWFTGNIGFHHLHHLSPRIPNYNLERAHYENPIFQKVQTITLLNSFKTVFLHLWDEQTHKLISWRDYYRLGRERAGQPAA